MMKLLAPAEIEERAYIARLSMVAVCKKAGINHSTWIRWKLGKTKPGIRVYEKLIAATSLQEDGA